MYKTIYLGWIDLFIEFLRSMSPNKVASKPPSSLIAPSRILLIIEGCPDRLIVRFTVKLYILLKNLFHWIYSNFYKDKHGHDFFLTSEVMEAVRGQKHPSEAKNIMKELIYWKKYLMKVSQQPQKPLSGPLAGPIRFELRPQVRKIQWPPRSFYVHSY